MEESPVTEKPQQTSPEPADDMSDAAMRTHLGYSLKRTYLVVHQVASDALDPFGLKVRSFSALSLIVANPGITPSRLAELLKIERSNLVLILDDLETRDLIGRTRDPGDRRRYALSATLAGRRLQEKATLATTRAEQRLTDRLSADEQDTLLALLRRIEDGLAG